jgi:hypothetical protein
MVALEANGRRDVPNQLRTTSMRHAALRAFLFSMALALSGCAAAIGSNQPPKRILQSSEDWLRDVDITLRATPPIGSVLPVQLAVTNMTTKGMTLKPLEIQGDLRSGTSMKVLTIDEAIQAAGGAQQLSKTLPRANLVHSAIHQSSIPAASASGVAAICLDSMKGGGGGGPGAGALFLLVCGGAATVAVAYRGVVAASPALQVKDLALEGGSLAPGIEDWGYVFLPAGDYAGIEVPIELDTGQTEIIVQAWKSAADLAAGAQSISVPSAVPQGSPQSVRMPLQATTSQSTTSEVQSRQNE